MFYNHIAHENIFSLKKKYLCKFIYRRGTKNCYKKALILSKNCSVCDFKF